ncbi:MAG: hypothetical protein J5623_00770 [Clostridiales bacterium]|nr:hypothetical protein [Clostridiales bacterium]
MNKEKWRKNYERVLTVLIFALTILFVYLFVVHLQGYRNIPELESLKGGSADWYEFDFYSYDGKTVEMISLDNSLEAQKTNAKLLKKVCSWQGRKADDWTKDKLTYPIYALKITPISIKGNGSNAETVVWSNGYLITSSGEVYKSNPDFGPFMKAGEKDRKRSAEAEKISSLRCFRPLMHANNVWNTECLSPSYITEDKLAEGIKATVKGIRVDDGRTVVTVELENGRDGTWMFCDKSLFVRVEVKIDGNWYYIHHDPNIDDAYTTLPANTAPLAAGKKLELDFNLAFYGKLPKGDYRIVVNGEDGSVVAEYKNLT